MKKYEPIKIFLKNNEISKQELLNSKIYKFLTKYNNEVFLSKIKSMCLESDPYRVRIRSDLFIQKAFKNGKGFLLCGIKLKNQKLFLCFPTNSFFNYPFKVNSSNSFINFDINKINSLINQNNSINTYIKKDQKILFFYSYLNNNFDENKFNFFLDNLNNLNPDHNQRVNDTIKTNKYDIPIQKDTKIKLEELYDYECALHYYNNSCLLALDWKKTADNIKNTNLSLPYEFHHFLPKKYFKLKSSIEKEDNLLNWDLINNEINIIPLCPLCHKSIHNNDKSLVKKKFNEIINVYKKTDRFELFEDYLMQNSNLDIDDLLKFYLNEINSEGKKYE